MDYLVGQLLRLLAFSLDHKNKCLKRREIAKDLKGNRATMFVGGWLPKAESQLV